MDHTSRICKRICTATHELERLAPVARLKALGAALLLAGLAATGPATAANDAALICSAGQRPCTGVYGTRCYTPSAGEQCDRGTVCGLGTRACLGRYGQGCYEPSRGDTCSQGLVCALGQRPCVRGDRAACFTPSAGETCN